MNVFFRAGLGLAVALILTPAGDASAQSATPRPAGPEQTQAARAAQQPADQPPPPTRPRRTKRSRRSSKRQPSLPARALVEQRRPSRDGGPTRQELTLTTNLLGGYDSNLPAAYGTGPGVVPSSMASGATRSMDATFGYFRGNGLRSIRMESTGNVLSYPGYLQHAVAGGAATVATRATVGRSLVVGASERIGYEPLFTVFSPGASTGPLPREIGQSVPGTGLFERRSLSSYTALSADRRWSARDSTTLSYSYGVQQFADGGHGDNTAHDVLAEYRRVVVPGIRARAAYRFVNADCIDYDGMPRATTEHRVEGGPEFETALSRRHRFALALAAGAGHVASAGAARPRYQAWTPIGSASAAFSFSPSWSLDGGYRRGFSLLRGVTDEVYTTDTAFLTTGARVTRRTDVRLGATYSSWRTSLIPGVDDRFRVYGASVQARFALTSTIGATAGYSYYHHRYSNPGELPVGFPAVYGRHAVSAGLTVWIPLLGNSSRPPLPWR